jgi:hypothetical protein
MVSGLAAYAMKRCSMKRKSVGGVTRSLSVCATIRSQAGLSESSQASSPGFASSRNGYTEDRPNPLSITNLSGRNTSSIEPFTKIHQIDLMLDANVCNGNLDNVPLGDPGNPIAASNRGEPKGYRLIERCRGDLDSV